MKLKIPWKTAQGIIMSENTSSREETATTMENTVIRKSTATSSATPQPISNQLDNEDHEHAIEVPNPREKSRSSPLRPDPSRSDRGTAEPAAGSKRDSGEAELFEYEAVGKLKRNRVRYATQPVDTPIGFHQIYMDVPLYVRLDRSGCLLVQVCKERLKSSGWTEKNIGVTFPSKVHIDYVVFDGEIKEYYEGDLQTASMEVKRKVVREYIECKLQLGTPSAKINSPVEDYNDILVGTHKSHSVEIYALLRNKTNSIEFRVHLQEISPLELPKSAVRYEDIEFAEEFASDSVETTKAKIKARISQSVSPEQGSSKDDQVSAKLPNEQIVDKDLVKAVKVAESALGDVEFIIRQRIDKLDADRGAIAAETQNLKEREDAVKFRENMIKASEEEFKTKSRELGEKLLKLKNAERAFDEKQKSLPSMNEDSTLEKERESLKRREIDLQSKEENWIKEKSEEFRNRHLALDAREERLGEQERVIIANQKTQSGTGPAVDSANTNTPSLKPLEILPEQSFKDLFKPLSASNPNAGMLSERKAQLLNLPETRFAGLQFRSTRILTEVPRIAVLGDLQPEKIVNGGETYDAYDHAGTTKLVQNPNRNSLIEHDGKLYVLRKFLREFTEEDPQ